MGNGVTKVGHCFSNSTAGDISCRHDIAVYVSDQLHKGLGHSFCYIKAEPPRTSTNQIHSEETTTFFSISGASVSANTSSSSSTDASLPYSCNLDEASAFESSDSFASVPLQPVPRRGGGGQLQSGSVSSPNERGFLSGPIERGFLSGPIERGFVSAPIDRALYSGLMEKDSCSKLQKSSPPGGFGIDEVHVKTKKRNSIIKSLKRVISNTISRGKKSFMGAVVVKDSVEVKNGEHLSGDSCNLSAQLNLNNDVDEDSVFSLESQNLQWAQGKAGEDRVHIVISEEHGWVFVGIYDGFNGPDAPDFLLSNLYTNVNEELKGLLWNDKFESSSPQTEETEEYSHSIGKENHPSDEVVVTNQRKQGKNLKHRSKGAAKRWEENQRRWRCEWDRERVELDRKLKDELNCQGSNSNGVNHFDVLRALSKALRKTEETYFEIADKMAEEKPELALMGSCVLVMLMKGEDVYLMNVGDSRAVLAQKGDTSLGLGKGNQDLEIISEESLRDLEVFDGDEFYRLNNLSSLQLTMDHSTYVHKEVQRIKKEHPDDPSAVTNDRVKGYLKVTRAFGVGFLKQPKWNDLLLEMFRIDYVGTSPYITCFPSLYHHKLNSRDRFLILSSDGLYQYFTNDEAISEVEMFIAAFPEGDPAQHLIEEVLFRAAKRAGIDFHELLDIPQGDRRRYHDDVSVIIISLEGRIWRSSV
ncbi:probable protein phosphatase 2C 4 [Ricinus communis]|uniref:protein-serine/threonine phosphatase n=1 Tax=Ricinus communis TaxID=3988 RepID=B9T262_RICCO|nr:probable protein phosphatase 2C 4 [Ricinus communis]EEF30058.1 protein phosphatase 2c, putative [Ricinus communis]|eukprot:XP_002532331.1 probable protein phosphatase 2C 4 [Ricinus communis]